MRESLIIRGFYIILGSFIVIEMGIDWSLLLLLLEINLTLTLGHFFSELSVVDNSVVLQILHQIVLEFDIGSPRSCLTVVLNFVKYVFSVSSFSVSKMRSIEILESLNYFFLESEVSFESADIFIVGFVIDV